MSLLTILSMLHEPADRNSATRQFRNRPVLSWTLERLRLSRHVADIVVLCWDDQLAAVQQAAGEQSVEIESRGMRHAIPALDAVTAARKWADGWRGGLFGTCAFDAGFDGPAFAELASDNAAGSVLVVDPASGLVDAAVIDAIVEKGAAGDTVELAFSQAAPGLGGVLVKRELLERLGKISLHPGRLLHYMPDQPIPDPIGGPGCAAVPTRVARTRQSVVLNSDRQLARVSAATVSLNGQLIDTGAETLVELLEAQADAGAMPREVVLELTTRRETRPIFSPLAHLSIERPDLPLESAEALFAQLARHDDVRLTLGGVGDPLLAVQASEIIAAARTAGVHAIHVETDLVGLESSAVEALARSGVDVVSVHLPALTQATYAAVMGGDRFAEAIQNLTRLLNARQAAGAGVPLVVPTFVKCQVNFGEMEAWYDQWLRVLGSAVIAGPSTYGGQIPDVGMAEMAPSLRRPCRRLSDRMTILSDGSVVSCEQDILGRQIMGSIRTEAVSDIWQREFAAVRDCHQQGALAQLPLCARCSEWHRA